jgi:hypothetical protein
LADKRHEMGHPVRDHVPFKETGYERRFQNRDTSRLADKGIPKYQLKSTESPAKTVEDIIGGKVVDLAPIQEVCWSGSLVFSNLLSS